mgnify:CR=1 FL=1
MGKILIAVMNSVSFDARVRRQAATLRAAGYDVHIVGEKDASCRAPRETWPNGVTVERVGLPHLLGRKARRAKTMRPSAKATAASAGEPPLQPLIGADLGDLPRPLFALRHSGAPLEMLWFQARRRVRDVAVARRIAAHGPDLVHVHDVEALPIGAFASRTSGAPLVFDAHEIYDQHAATKASREAKRRRKTHTIARFAADVDGFVTINDSIAGYYRAHFPRLPEAVVVGNATSPPPPGPYDGRLHEAAGLDRGTRIALYQGKFLPRRNLPELVETAAHLSPAWALVFMGWGDLKAELEARRDALPAEARARVRFVDPVPHGELLTWTAGAAVGVMPYDNHTLNHWFCTPNKLWEFPQAGVPILVSPFPEMRRRVEAHGHGWLLADPFDPRHTARLLESLDEAELGRARAACARFNAADNWELYEARLLALYARLLERDAGEDRDQRKAAA